MREQRFEQLAVNAERLHEELLPVPGFMGFSTGPGWLAVFSEDNADELALRSVVLAHDPAVKSAAQIAREERQLILDAGRTAPALDPAGFDMALVALVEKANWLEAEVRELRGL